MKYILSIVLLMFALSGVAAQKPVKSIQVNKKQEVKKQVVKKEIPLLKKPTRKKFVKK